MHVEATIREKLLTPSATPTRTYLTPISDNRRWSGFELRAGDIVVAAPPKSGTTWVQMLCALLVHQNPVFPEPLTRLSRWLDRTSEPIEIVSLEYARQKFRRIIKTHTPFDGIPYREDVSYVFCGRDPRDVFLSLRDQAKNTSEKVRNEIRQRQGIPPDVQVPQDPNVIFPVWLIGNARSEMGEHLPPHSIFHMIESYWAFRHLPNVMLLHYQDLCRDLDAQARSLSQFLAIAVDEKKWAVLLGAADFQAMKNQAEELAPGAHTGDWASPRDFFRSGRLNNWKDILTAPNKKQYEVLCDQFLDPELRSWLENE